MLATCETLAYDATKRLLVIRNPRASAEDETKLFQKNGWVEVPEHEFTALLPPSPRLKGSNKLHKTHSGTSIDSGHHTAEANEHDSTHPPAGAVPVHKRVYRLADGRTDKSDRAQNKGIQVTIEHTEDHSLDNQDVQQTFASASSANRSCVVV